MPFAKKILITTDSREIVIVRKYTPLVGFCNVCGAELPELTLDEAVHFAGTSTLGLIRDLEAGRIHGKETAEGHLLICQASLESFRKEGI